MRLHMHQGYGRIDHAQECLRPDSGCEKRGQPADKSAYSLHQRHGPDELLPRLSGRGRYPGYCHVSALRRQLPAGHREPGGIAAGNALRHWPGSGASHRDQEVLREDHRDLCSGLQSHNGSSGHQCSGLSGSRRHAFQPGLSAHRAEGTGQV